jgi:putative AlgH/UPF0301 family transcriptional regulator
MEDLSKIQELKNAIGQVYSENYSSTNTAQLLSVDLVNGVWMTTSKEVKSEYGNAVPKKKLVVGYAVYTWNALFY